MWLYSTLTTALFLMWVSFVHSEGAAQPDTWTALTACCCQKGQSHSPRPCFPTFSAALQAVWSHPLHCTALALIWPLSESVEFVKPTKNCWLFCGVSLLLAQWTESAHSTVKAAVMSSLRGSLAACRLGRSEGEEIEGWTGQNHPF